MGRIAVRVAASLMLLGVMTGARSGEVQADGARPDSAHARTAVQALMPHGKIASIAASGSKGYFEVVVDGQVVYISDDGKHLFTGELWEVEGRRNLTAHRKNGLRHDALAAVGAEKRIVFAAEQPKHTVTVLTDFDCGYCQRLHQDIAQYNARGISVEYLLYPRDGLDSASFDKAVSVWCAVDRKQAFTLAKGGTAPPSQSCPNSVADNYSLVDRIGGIIGTPAVIDAQGAMTGYQSPDQMLARLDAVK